MKDIEIQTLSKLESDFSQCVVTRICPKKCPLLQKWILKVTDIIAILTCSYKDEVWNIIKESCWSSNVVIIDSLLRSRTSAPREMGRFLVSSMISLLSRGPQVLLHRPR